MAAPSTAVLPVHCCCVLPDPAASGRGRCFSEHQHAGVLQSAVLWRRNAPHWLRRLCGRPPRTPPASRSGCCCPSSRHTRMQCTPALWHSSTCHDRQHRYASMLILRIVSKNLLLMQVCSCGSADGAVLRAQHTGMLSLQCTAELQKVQQHRILSVGAAGDASPQPQPQSLTERPCSGQKATPR